MSKVDTLTTHRKMIVAFECMQSAQNVLDRCPKAIRNEFGMEHRVDVDAGVYVVLITYYTYTPQLYIDLKLLAEVDKDRRVKTVKTRVTDCMKELRVAEQEIRMVVKDD